MDKVTNIPGRMAFQMLISSDKMVEGWDAQPCTNLTELWGIKRQHCRPAALGSRDREFRVSVYICVPMSLCLIFPAQGKLLSASLCHRCATHSDWLSLSPVLTSSEVAVCMYCGAWDRHGRGEKAPTQELGKTGLELGLSHQQLCDLEEGFCWDTLWLAGKSHKQCRAFPSIRGPSSSNASMMHFSMLRS